ncbi:hypothetical protein MUK42_18734 [Musa troglodytarum]|uniref:Uncharacterized protein n=1 Tax=Musa troglodytarum TaxID=320322 RepID=A0A9E7FFA8_9LILI|nr:hypothetical protein MUK42_18734 [Musa troglodytarum]
MLLLELLFTWSNVFTALDSERSDLAPTSLLDTSSQVKRADTWKNRSFGAVTPSQNSSIPLQ